jgi:hypothetical protein
MRELVINMTVESWHMVQLIYNVLNKLDILESEKYIGQINWFNKKIKETLETLNMRIVNLVGEPYDPGMAVRALNIEEFEPTDQMYIDNMLDPLIMGNDGIVRFGTVTLRRF